jgi:phage gp16-like protein
MNTVKKLSNPKVGLIRVAISQLGWDDATYRIALKEVTGCHSSSDCTDRQLNKFIEHLKSKGFVAKPKKSWAPKAAPAPMQPAAKPSAKTLGNSDQENKLRALWAEMAEFGFVRNGSEQALVEYITKQAKIDAAQWMNSLVFQNIIERLKRWRFRDEKALAKKTGKTVEELQALAMAEFGDQRLTADTLAKLKSIWVV